jgi:uncharacterized protein (TIGR03067 family)
MVTVPSLVVVGAGAPGADDANKEAAKDVARMTGTWRVAYAESNGKKLPRSERRKMRLVQRGAEWTFRSGDAVVGGTDRLDPTHTPRWCESRMTKGPDKGKTILSIYEIKGDTMKTCWADAGKPRPTEFATRAGSGQHYLVLKRVKRK